MAVVGVLLVVVCVLLILALLFSLPYGVVAIVVTIARARREEWVAVRPEVLAVPIEHLPPAAKKLAEEVASPLAAEGFAFAAAVHAPEWAVNCTWSQALFLNRDTGERASVMLIAPPGAAADAPAANLAVATEMRGGPTVVTQTEPAGSPVDVAGVLAEHRRRVETAGPAVGDAVLPEVGSEADWLAGRAALVAADTARRLGMRPDRRRVQYRPGWVRTLQAAVRRPVGRRRVEPRGFAVRPAGGTSE